MDRWYVVNTRPHQEVRAQINLQRQGYRAWLPTMERSRRHARRIDTVTMPVFPGYLFVRLNLDSETWGPINGTFGVKRLLTEGARPRAVPADFVDALRRQIAPDGTCVPANDAIKPGDAVRITLGPFVDCIATVLKLTSRQRVELLLEVLGGGVTATLPARALALAS